MSWNKIRTGPPPLQVSGLCPGKFAWALPLVDPGFEIMETGGQVLSAVLQWVPMRCEVLSTGEKIHIVHRRLLETEPHRHFVGLVEAYEDGIARVSGYIFTVDPVRFEFVPRPEPRTRIVSLLSGDVLVNIIPPGIDLDKVVYRQEAKAVRVTDGSSWHLDLSELPWM
jgi:hypothetical protein